MSFLDTINITKLEQQYDKLVDEISDIVYQTQRNGRGDPLPNKIIMSKKQQKMLRRYPMMKSMYGTKQKYWLTEHNVMECVVAQLA